MDIFNSLVSQFSEHKAFFSKLEILLIILHNEHKSN